jgi:hypothetical protein
MKGKKAEAGKERGGNFPGGRSFLLRAMCREHFCFYDVQLLLCGQGRRQEPIVLQCLPPRCSFLRGYDEEGKHEEGQKKKKSVRWMPGGHERRRHEWRPRKSNLKCKCKCQGIPGISCFLSGGPLFFILFLLLFWTLLAAYFLFWFLFWVFFFFFFPFLFFWGPSGPILDRAWAVMGRADGRQKM